MSQESNWNKVVGSYEEKFLQVMKEAKMQVVIRQIEPVAPIAKPRVANPTSRVLNCCRKKTLAKHPPIKK